MSCLGTHVLCECVGLTTLSNKIGFTIRVFALPPTANLSQCVCVQQQDGPSINDFRLTVYMHVAAFLRKIDSIDGANIRAADRALGAENKLRRAIQTQAMVATRDARVGGLL